MLFVSTRGKTDLVSRRMLLPVVWLTTRSVRTAEIPGTFAGRDCVHAQYDL